MAYFICLFLTLIPFSLKAFDNLFIGDPREIETNLRALLPEVSHSVHIEILSQIALAQAMQKEFTKAHETLSQGENMLLDGETLAKGRLLLERGRTFWQSGDEEKALPFLEAAYELFQSNNLDEHTCNAAHLIAILSKTPEEKIKWNLIAIRISEEKVPAWNGSLYNNLGMNYLEMKDYEKALLFFQKTLEIRKQERIELNIQVAKWQIGKTLVQMDKTTEALEIFLSLDAKELEGYLLFEIANIYAKQKDPRAQQVAKRAYEILSQDEWFMRLESEKLEVLKEIVSI